MSLAATAERDELRATIRRFVDAQGGIDRAQDATNGRHRAGDELWRRLAVDLALQGLAVDERYGGSGAGYQELGVAFEELGRALVPEPYLASLGLALPIMQRSDSADALLRGLVAGEQVLALAWSEPHDPWNHEPQSTTAERQGDDWLVTGAKRFVLGGDVATTALVTAHTVAGPSIVAVDLADQSVRRSIHRAIDGSRGFADLDFESAPGALVIEPGGGVAALTEALDIGNAMLANEMVGAAQACLDMTVEYAGARRQFERPIGSFQAIKHKLAECYVALEGATAVAHYAAWAADHDRGELACVGPTAKFVAGEACFRIAGDAIQVHGGIGFTWEHAAHLYFKHAKTSLMLHGDADHTLACLADRLAL